MFSLLPSRHAHISRPPQAGDRLDVVEFLDLSRTKHIVVTKDGSPHISVKDEHAIRRILASLRKSGRLINAPDANGVTAVVSFHLEGVNRYGWAHFDVAYDKEHAVLHRGGLGIPINPTLKVLLDDNRPS